MKRITGFISTLVIFIIGFALGALATQAGLLQNILGSQTPVMSVTSILNQIQLVSELTTTRYDTSGSVTIEREMPPVLRALYGDRLVLFGAGTVTAGIDLEHLTAERLIATQGGGLEVRLPYPQLLDCILKENETRVLAREVALFTWEDREFETIARRTLTIHFRNTALENGIYEEAKGQAETVVRTLIGTTQPGVPLTIVFDDPPAQSVIPASCRDANAPAATPTP